MFNIKDLCSLEKQLTHIGKLKYEAFGCISLWRTKKEEQVKEFHLPSPYIIDLLWSTTENKNVC